MNATKTKPLITSYLFEQAKERCVPVKVYDNEWTKNFTRELLSARRAKEVKI